MKRYLYHPVNAVFLGFALAFIIVSKFVSPLAYNYLVVQQGVNQQMLIKHADYSNEYLHIFGHKILIHGKCNQLDYYDLKNGTQTYVCVPDDAQYDKLGSISPAM